MAKLIAELGINHQGDKEKLFRMMRSLVKNKISCCKLQYRSSENFFSSSLEMGSTLISQELSNANLSLTETVEAVNYARNLDLEIGVSFFRVKDAGEFLAKSYADFFKVPSAEALNFELIRLLQTQNRPVYVSTGGLTKYQLDALAANIDFKPHDCVMYCVANYPAALGSSIPVFIEKYRDLFGCQIGYSSHDLNWEMNVAFLSKGVDIIERHFAESRLDKGLDISTSSDLDEMRLLQSFCNLDVWKATIPFEEKTPNQGEIQNLKDLGSGYYFMKNSAAGTSLKLSDFEIKSPCRGVQAGSIKEPVLLKRPAKLGDALSHAHFLDDVELPQELRHQCDFNKISLPVRLHDFLEIESCFGLKNYEWHLSFSEVQVAEQTILNFPQHKIKEKQFSIHLPDYASSQSLIDPLSNNRDIRLLSRDLIEKTSQLAIQLQELTGSQVPIVGSFSVNFDGKEKFYSELSELISELYDSTAVRLLPQFLPKMAWYFGGSVEVDVFCSIDDLHFYQALPFGLCLDSAHCIMAANFFRQSPEVWLKALIPLAQHIHVSDAIGVDGEGVPFGKGEIGPELDLLLEKDVPKVVEQWEGHLNNFTGFKEALLFLGDRLR